MQCRPGCAACCTAPSITTPMPGMPHGKKAGEPCIHLDEDGLCMLFEQNSRPKFCVSLQAHPEMCGNCRSEAMKILELWEELTTPKAILSE